MLLNVIIHVKCMQRGVGVVMYSEEEWAWSCTERSGRDHVQKGVGVAMYREVWVWSLVLRRTK